MSVLFLINLSNAEVIKGESAQSAIPDINLSNYILGPGDKTEIKVYRNEDLSFTLTIDPSGKISYPLLGDIQAAGVTVFELRDIIKKGLSKYFKNPQVMVNLTAYQSQKITVLGGVVSPGVFNIDRQPSILEIISRSGGFSSSSDRSNVIVIRKQKSSSTVLNLDLKMALGGDKTKDILLMKDDIVYVPSESNKLIVLGEVTTPGSVSLEREFTESPMSVLDVIAKVGGFSTNADRTQVLVIRKDGEKIETKKIDIKKILEEGNIDQKLIVKKSDIIFVPKSEKRITVLGEVKSPGNISFESPIYLLEVIAKAGGFSMNANKNNVMLIRNGNKTSTVMVLNPQRMIETGDTSQNPVLQNEDVVFVPFENKRVIVLGEVTTPGYYSYTEPLNVLDAIGKAGGFLSRANRNNVFVARKGEIKKFTIEKILKHGIWDENTILQNGDLVYVSTNFITDVEDVLGHISRIFQTVSSVISPFSVWESLGKGTTPVIIQQTQ